MEVKTYKGKEILENIDKDEMLKMLEKEKKKAENFKPFDVHLMYDSSDDTVLFMCPDKKTFNSVEISFLMTKALNELVTQHSLYRSLRRSLTIAYITNIMLIVSLLIKLFVK